ncbi:MAG: KdsC family phosphatase [Legionella sp.]
MNDLLVKAKQIKCLICDIDGVLTNGLLYMDNFGHELKAFHVHDGVGIKLLLAAGIQVAVITNSQNAIVEHRMRQLGINHYFTGQLDKNKAYQTLKINLHLKDEDIAYIGDDLPDLPIIKQVGLGVAVGNAVDDVKKHAIWLTKNHGGCGAVRELCDLILSSQNRTELALNNYLSS